MLTRSSAGVQLGRRRSVDNHWPSHAQYESARSLAHAGLQNDDSKRVKRTHAIDRAGVHRDGLSICSHLEEPHCAGLTHLGSKYYEMVARTTARRVSHTRGVDDEQANQMVMGLVTGTGSYPCQVWMDSGGQGTSQTTNIRPYAIHRDDTLRYAERTRTCQRAQILPPASAPPLQQGSHDEDDEGLPDLESDDSEDDWLPDLEG